LSEPADALDGPGPKTSRSPSEMAARPLQQYRTTTLFTATPLNNEHSQADNWSIAVSASRSPAGRFFGSWYHSKEARPMRPQIRSIHLGSPEIST